MDNLPKVIPGFPQPPDSLNELSDSITEMLKKHDCFDFNVSVKRLNALKKIIEGRDLEWAYAMDDPEPYQGVVVLVVGVQGADFEKHERDR